MKDRRKTISRVLRKNQTPQEGKLWYNLRNKQLYNLKFRRQVKFGSYVADFCCPSKKIVIEIDGGQHNEDLNIEKDKVKQKFIEKQGYKVLRYWNNDVDDNLEGVVEDILRNCGIE